MILCSINNLYLNSVSRSVSGGNQCKTLKNLLYLILFFINAPTGFYNEANLGDLVSGDDRELMKD